LSPRPQFTGMFKTDGTAATAKSLLPLNQDRISKHDSHH
jgi:hypothetical protein